MGHGNRKSCADAAELNLELSDTCVKGAMTCTMSHTIFALLGRRCDPNWRELVCLVSSIVRLDKLA